MERRQPYAAGLRERAIVDGEDEIRQQPWIGRRHVLGHRFGRRPGNAIEQHHKWQSDMRRDAAAPVPLQPVEGSPLVDLRRRPQ